MGYICIIFALDTQVKFHQCYELQGIRLYVYNRNPQLYNITMETPYVGVASNYISHHVASQVKCFSPPLLPFGDQPLVERA